MLPKPVLLELRPGQVKASVEDRSLPAELQPNHHVLINPEPQNPASPLLVFDPSTSNYGLVQKEQNGVVGLQEHVKSAGSQQVVVNDRFGPDGIRYAQEVHTSPLHQVQAWNVAVSPAGQVQSQALMAHVGPFQTTLANLSNGLPVTTYSSFSQVFRAGPSHPSFLAFFAALSPGISPGGPGARVEQGDIARVPAQAIVTTIDSAKNWRGPTDHAISGVAGGQYHAQALWQAEQAPLYDGQILLANRMQPHGGAFEKVLFLVDDLKRPVGDVVSAGLLEADRLKLNSVTLPPLRPDQPGSTEAVASAIKRFSQAQPVHLRQVTVVVSDNPQLAEDYRNALQ